MFEFTQEAPSNRVVAGARRVLFALPRLGVGVLFLVIGYGKFDDDPSGSWVQIFERIGIGQWFRYVTGVIQVTGGVLMLFRRTLTAGAALLACTMLGAAFVDGFVLGSPVLIVPLLLFIVIATVWATSQ